MSTALFCLSKNYETSCQGGKLWGKAAKNIQSHALKAALQALSVVWEVGQGCKGLPHHVGNKLSMFYHPHSYFFIAGLFCIALAETNFCWSVYHYSSPIVLPAQLIWPYCYPFTWTLHLEPTKRLVTTLLIGWTHCGCHSHKLWCYMLLYYSLIPPLYKIDHFNFYH